MLHVYCNIGIKNYGGGGGEAPESGVHPFQMSGAFIEGIHCTSYFVQLEAHTMYDYWVTPLTFFNLSTSGLL